MTAKCEWLAGGRAEAEGTELWHHQLGTHVTRHHLMGTRHPAATCVLLGGATSGEWLGLAGPPFRQREVGLLIHSEGCSE